MDGCRRRQRRQGRCAVRAGERKVGPGNRSPGGWRAEDPQAGGRGLRGRHRDRRDRVMTVGTAAAPATTAAVTAPPWPANLPPMPVVDHSQFGEVETVALSRTQKLVAS